ncbi:N-acetylneuraminate synthase [Bosea sp. AAP35]|uniref:N-acetylneuraminate synthase family protein n=1 Tax=Bosea sp. AAP35 TaxID=1523417 RepID=UPI0006B9C1DF|nr:N-acetylneuraminate synthase family protein [Bosea sp. AAP35]KPF66574.1 N-acetylneuraminate synthase [Bosea sp. AAP35]
MTRQFNIGNRVITDESSSFVIAEIGHNHQGDMEKCKALFKAAHEVGADAVKLQKRDNRALFTAEMYDSSYDSENAYAPTYGTHREKLEFNKDQYLELQDYARELDLIFFSTAFDRPSADLLEEIDMPAYKIASGDLTNIPLLKHIAGFGKPMIISTGGGTMPDVRRAYEAIKPINSNFCILQCTSGYPPVHEELNLRVIENFRQEFPDIVIGFSSHDSGVAMPLVGYMLGARVFEKHFTLNRAWKGTDQSFSLEPAGLRRVVRDLERARVSLGDGKKSPYFSESAPLSKMVKRIVAAGPLKAGHVLTEDDLAYKIPVSAKISDFALLAYENETLIGKPLLVDVAQDELITAASIGVSDRAA